MGGAMAGGYRRLRPRTGLDRPRRAVSRRVAVRLGSTRDRLWTGRSPCRSRARTCRCDAVRTGDHVQADAPRPVAGARAGTTRRTELSTRVRGTNGDRLPARELYLYR